jgi:hypothetical protein
MFLNQYPKDGLEKTYLKLFTIVDHTYFINCKRIMNFFRETNSTDFLGLTSYKELKTEMIYFGFEVVMQ